jgi:restriction system protein
MRRYKSVSQRYADSLTRVTWQDFERLLATYYAGQGYQVEHVGTANSGTPFDGGIDLKLRRDGHYLLVQCKHWITRQVTHNAVHELLGVMLTERADGAIVVTSGEFTPAAKAAAGRESRVQLIDGAALREMLGSLTDAFVPPLPDENFSMAFHARGGSAGTPRHPRRRRRASRNPLPAIALALIAAWIGWIVIRHALTQLGQAVSSRTAATAMPPTPSSLSTTLPSPQSVVRSPWQAARRSTLPPTNSSIDTSAMPVTEAELRAWKIRNAAAMKIIEKTTPQMPLR